MKATIYSDGGARGNPGPAASSALLFIDEKLKDFDAKYLGKATNNQAEYEGLLLGLEMAKNNTVEYLKCFLDSELVVKQLMGVYKVKDEKMKILEKKVRELIKDFSSVEFIHIERSKNFLADRLVNLIIDAATK